jgi:hypothetical protein
MKGNLIVDRELLMTASVLDSFKWMITCPSSWRDKAVTDFSNALNRVYTDMDPAVKRGIDFENRICRDLYLGRDAFVNRHGELLVPFFEKCAAGRQQVTVKKGIEVDGQKILLYGKADIYIPGKGKDAGASKIIDIKTTGRWKGIESYTSKAQHLLYMVADNCAEFEYLVAVFDDKIGKAEAVIPIPVEMSYEDAYAELMDKIRRFLAYVRGDEALWKAYTTVFTKDFSATR